MPTPADALELRRLLQSLFRRFGVLGGDHTPCGQPLSPAHAHALMVLAARGELTQGALGVELGIDKSNVARLCARLEADAHATRRADPGDARVRLVVLTEKGQRLARRVEVSSTARFGDVFARIPPETRPEVLRALGALVTAVERSQAVSLASPPPKGPTT